jgi:hypothetical protein
MYFVVKKNILPYPLHLTLLSPNAVVHGPDRFPNLIQKPWLSCFGIILVHFRLLEARYRLLGSQELWGLKK